MRSCMLASQVPWAAAVVLMLTAPGSALAGWRAQGTPVGVLGSPQTLPVICGDGNGGAYIAWRELGRIQVQHFSAAGVPAPGWPSEGLFGAAGPFGWNPILAPDGQGGVFITWRHGNSLSYGRITADGTVSATSAESPRPRSHDPPPTPRWPRSMPGASAHPGC